MTLAARLQSNIQSCKKVIYSYDITNEELSNEDLYQNACSMAGYLHGKYGSGNRVLVLCDSPFDFIQVFVAIIFSGNIPIPYKKANKRNLETITKILKSAQSQLIISDEILSNFVEVEQITVLTLLQHKYNTVKYRHEAHLDETAYIQYSSGSTGTPKGVVITHRNMLKGLENIYDHGRHIFDTKQKKGDLITCSWLPHYHDMGLVGGILAPLYANTLCYIMHPKSFIHDPMNWLQKISDVRANFSPAPNFAYEYCIKNINNDKVESLDLSSWDVAYNGAESVSLTVMQDFAHKFEKAKFNIDTFFPTYGLAEYTLMASVRREIPLKTTSKRIPKNDEFLQTEAVSCGKAVEPDGVAILSFDQDNKCKYEQIGEIALKGDSLLQGYLDEGEVSYRDKMSSIGYFRTGDIGFLDKNDELYVIGRIDDKISIRGKNIFPSALESKVAKLEGVLKAVLLKVDSRLIFVLESKKEIDFDKIASEVLMHTIEEINISLSQVVFVRGNLMPRTSSGKIRRNLLTAKLQSKTIKTLCICNAPVHNAEAVPEKSNDVSIWLKNWLSLKADISDFHAYCNKSFSDFGLDSLSAAILIADINTVYALDIDVIALWEYPTPDAFIRYVESEIKGVNS